MLYLSQCSTNTLKIGPFIDDADGATGETGLTLAKADIRLSKNGGNMAEKTETSSCTHDEIAIYDCPIGSADTSDLGRLKLFVHQTGSLSVFHEYMVIPKQVYDSLVLGSDSLDVETKSFLSTLDLTANMKSAVAAECASAIATCTTTVGAIADIDFTATMKSALNTAFVSALGTTTVTVGAINDIDFPATMKGTISTECGSAIKTNTTTVGAIADIDFSATMKSTLNTEIVSAFGTSTVTVGGFNAAGKTDIRTEVTSALSTTTVTVGAINNIDFSATMKSTLNAEIVSALGTSTVTVGGYNAAGKTVIRAEVGSALNTAFVDGDTLVANGLKERLRVLGWLLRNKITVTDANGNTVIYKDDGTTTGFSVAAALADDGTTTTRKRMA